MSLCLLCLFVAFKFFPAFWIPFFGLGVLGAFLGVLQGRMANHRLFLSFVNIGFLDRGSVFSYLTCARVPRSVLVQMPGFHEPFNLNQFGRSRAKPLSKVTATSLLYLHNK